MAIKVQNLFNILLSLRAGSLVVWVGYRGQGRRSRNREPARKILRQPARGCSFAALAHDTSPNLLVVRPITRISDLCVVRQPSYHAVMSGYRSQRLAVGMWKPTLCHFALADALFALKTTLFTIVARFVSK